jgi:hypothetical protein
VPNLEENPAISRRLGELEGRGVGRRERVPLKSGGMTMTVAGRQ